MKTEQFECSYAIYQVSDGTFRVWRLDEKGSRTKLKGKYEFYANAVCALIRELVK